ncbi:MAG: hypothetical protein V7K30_10940 [Nostoc sp.]
MCRKANITEWLATLHRVKQVNSSNLAVTIHGIISIPGEIKTCDQLMPNAASGKLTHHISVKIIGSPIIHTFVASA